jgi:hypothetical protein
LDAAMALTSSTSRKVSTPGRFIPGMSGLIGCEPVANTSLENDSRAPPASVTLRAAASTAVARTP